MILDGQARVSQVSYPQRREEPYLRQRGVPIIGLRRELENPFLTSSFQKRK